jgi:hypothetical protein
MTLPYERTRSVIGARQLLIDLAAAPTTQVSRNSGSRLEDCFGISRSRLIFTFQRGLLPAFGQTPTQPAMHEHVMSQFQPAQGNLLQHMRRLLVSTKQSRPDLLPWLRLCGRCSGGNRIRKMHTQAASEERTSVTSKRPSMKSPRQRSSKMRGMKLREPSFTKNPHHRILAVWLAIERSARLLTEITYRRTIMRCRRERCELKRDLRAEHIHASSDHWIGDCCLICNPRGRRARTATTLTHLMRTPISTTHSS